MTKEEFEEQYFNMKIMTKEEFQEQQKSWYEGFIQARVLTGRWTPEELNAAVIESLEKRYQEYVNEMVRRIRSIEI